MENNNLQIALQQGVITQDTYNRIIEFRQRLIDNNVLIIYNLKQITKIFRIQKRQQENLYDERKNS